MHKRLMAICIAVVVALTLGADRRSSPENDEIEVCLGGRKMFQISSIGSDPSVVLYSAPNVGSTMNVHLASGDSGWRVEQCLVVRGERFRWCRVRKANQVGWLNSAFLKRMTSTSDATHTIGGCDSSETG